MSDPEALVPGPCGRSGCPCCVDRRECELERDRLRGRVAELECGQVCKHQNLKSPHITHSLPPSHIGGWCGSSAPHDFAASLIQASSDNPLPLSPH